MPARRWCCSPRPAAAPRRPGWRRGCRCTGRSAVPGSGGAGVAVRDVAGDPDVVDEHLLRELGAAVGVAGPVTTDRHVEDHEEGVVEDPAVTTKPTRVDPEELRTVEVPADDVRLPVHPVGVEGVGQRLSDGAAAGDPAAAGVARSVDGAVHGVRLPPDVLHDVDLAGGRPADVAEVVAEHPERRPDSLTSRDLDARLEPPVRLAERGRGQQSGRGVLAPAVVALVVGRVLPAGGDDQVALAVVHRVAGAVGVVLPFVVAQPWPPMSKRHLDWSTGVPAGELNSSCQVMPPIAAAAGADCTGSRSALVTRAAPRAAAARRRLREMASTMESPRGWRADTLARRSGERSPNPSLSISTELVKVVNSDHQGRASSTGG